MAKGTFDVTLLVDHTLAESLPDLLAEIGSEARSLDGNPLWGSDVSRAEASAFARLIGERARDKALKRMEGIKRGGPTVYLDALRAIASGDNLKAFKLREIAQDAIERAKE